MKHDEKNLDELIERGLRSYMAQPLPAGLEQRVLARVAEDGERSSRMQIWWRWAVPVFAACVIALVLVSRQPEKRPREIAVQTASKVVNEIQPHPKQSAPHKKLLASAAIAKHVVLGDAFFALTPQEVARDQKMEVRLDVPVWKTAPPKVEQRAVVVMDADGSWKAGNFKDVNISDISVDLETLTKDNLPGESDEENYQAN